MLSDRFLSITLPRLSPASAFAAYCYFRGGTVFGVPERRRALRGILDHLRGHEKAPPQVAPRRGGESLTAQVSDVSLALGLQAREGIE